MEVQTSPIKARIKKTGRKVILTSCIDIPFQKDDERLYSDGKGWFSSSELEFLPNDYDMSVPDIDWEQRRYEIAKDVLSSLEVHSQSNIGSDCKLAIELADELIKQLTQ